MTPILTAIIAILAFSAAYLTYALAGALRNLTKAETELDDLHAHITALEREVKTLTPKRDAKGLFMRKPKHNSATDPVVIEMRRG